MGRFEFTNRCLLTPNKGFTILELLISVALMAILTSVAAPSFASMIHNGQVKTSAAALSATIALSRNHALSTATTVVVCHAKDKLMTLCSDSRKRNTNWANGIISYADLNHNNTLDKSDKILATIQKQKNIVIVFNQNGRLRFFPNGGSRSAGFYLCSRMSTKERHLKILHTGRTRTSSKMTQTHRQTCLSKAV